MLDLDYYDSCPDCDSIDIDVRIIKAEDSKQTYEAVCRECGSEWFDSEDFI